MQGSPVPTDHALGTFAKATADKADARIGQTLKILEDGRNGVIVSSGFWYSIGSESSWIESNIAISNLLKQRAIGLVVNSHSPLERSLRKQ